MAIVDDWSSQMDILIRAYLDRNFGDDVMLKMLVDKLKEFRLTIICPDESLLLFLKDYKNVRLVRLAGNPLKRVKQYASFDIMVKVGGSIFNIGTGLHFQQRWINTFRRLLQTLELWIATQKGMELAIVGCNIGPFGTWLGACVARWELSFSKFITVRDKCSFKEITKKKQDRIRMYFPDIVLGCGSVVKEFPHANNCLGISAYQCESTEINEVLNDKLAAIADCYLSKTDGKVLLFAFDSGREDDVEAARKIFGKISHKRCVEIVSYSGDPSVVFQGMARCSSVVAIRFHSAIISMLLGIPFLPIVYANKMDNLLDDIDYSSSRFHLDRICLLDAEAVAGILIDKMQLCSYEGRQLAQKAQGHLDALLAYIKKDSSALQALAVNMDKGN